MNPEQLAAIRERAHGNGLGRNLLNVCNQAIADRRALLDHVDELTAEVKRVEAQRRDCFEHADKWVTEADRLVARLEAVRELHKPTIEGAITGDCATDECDHEDECPLEPIEVCAECHRLAEEVDAYYGEETIEPTTWPCPTIQAIGETN